MTGASARSIGGSARSSAPLVGVVIGLTLLTSFTAVQVVLVIFGLGSPDLGVLEVVGWVTAPLLVLAILTTPLLRSAWPVSPGRALAVGVSWLVVGLATAPLWLALGAVQLVGPLLAAVPALAGALWGGLAQAGR